MDLLNRILLYAVAITLPIFIPSWHGKLTGLLSVLWLVTIIIDKQITIEKPFKPFLLLSSGIFLINVVGIFYSNGVLGKMIIESVAPLLVLPLIILTSKQIVGGRASISNAIICFIAGVIFLNLASLVFISYDLWDSKNLQANLILANNSIVQIHPAFLSLYISISIFFLVDRYFPLQGNDRSKLGWVLFSLVTLTVYLIWLSSRAGILGFFIAALFYIFYRYKRRTRWVAFSVLAFVLILVVAIPFSRVRFIEAPLVVLSGSVTEDHKRDPNVYPILARKHIFSCSIDILNGPELLYGYGTGDARDVLRTCLQEKGYTKLAQANLDAHNEYFAELHRHGILGLLFFVGLLVYVFWYALKNKSALLAVFIILFSITALFETVLSSQKGATFFALLCPLLMLYAKQQAHPSGGKP